MTTPTTTPTTIEAERLQATMAGALIFETASAAVLAEMTAGMDPERLVRVYAGLMAATVGAACKALGTTATQALLMRMVSCADTIAADVTGRH